MTDDDKARLYQVIRDYHNRYHGPYMRTSMEQKIAACHMHGDVDGRLVTNENLPLFRQYRNSVSPNPRHMLDAALKGAEVSG
jgi:hypothetical protein